MHQGTTVLSPRVVPVARRSSLSFQGYRAERNEQTERAALERTRTKRRRLAELLLAYGGVPTVSVAPSYHRECRNGEEGIGLLGIARRKMGAS